MPVRLSWRCSWRRCARSACSPRPNLGDEADDSRDEIQRRADLGPGSVPLSVGRGIAGKARAAGSRSLRPVTAIGRRSFLLALAGGGHWRSSPLKSFMENQLGADSVMSLLQRMICKRNMPSMHAFHRAHLRELPQVVESKGLFGRNIRDIHRPGSGSPGRAGKLLNHMTERRVPHVVWR
jgi:hypothetical protein